MKKKEILVPKNLKIRMVPEEDVIHVYPVIDCPKCRRSNMPVGWNNMFFRPEPYCLNCHEIIEDLKPKGYVTQSDLEDTEWGSEL